MTTESINWFVFFGVILNSVIAVFIIKMAEAGHSIFAYYFGYILPLLSLFSYLSYRKFRDSAIETLQIKHFLRPSLILSLIIVFGFLIASIIFDLIYNESFTLSTLNDLGLFIVAILLVVVIPNLVLQSIFSLLHFKRKNN